MEEKAEQSRKELEEKIPEMISSAMMQVMLSSFMPKILPKDLKERDPEKYYGLKAKFRELHGAMKKASVDLEESLAEMT